MTHNTEIGQAIRQVRNKLSSEYHIRSAVVKRLLDEGVDRQNIRIELSLSREDKMYSGRADIVIIEDDCLVCIELKSGRDFYSEDSLWEQCRSYEKSFDYIASIVDFSHFRLLGQRDNWCGSIRATYCHKSKQLKDCYRGELYEFDSLLDFLLRGGATTATNPWVMARLLTTEELNRLVGGYSYLKDNRENMSLSLIRPFVVKALRERPLNKHEQRFWARFNMEHGDGK